MLCKLCKENLFRIFSHPSLFLMDSLKRFEVSVAWRAQAEGSGVLTRSFESKIAFFFFTFFLSPVRVTSILKGHGERIVLHKDSHFFCKCGLCSWPLVVALGCLQPISFAKICIWERCECLIPPFWRSASVSGWCGRKIVHPKASKQWP